MSIPLPQTLSLNEEKKNKTLVSIEPCVPGYGVTLGNSLRRVLLASIPGSAVSGFKIKGVDHEFTTIPYVKEDVVEIILNLKKVRLKSFANESITLILNGQGNKVLTAKDIEKNPQIKIGNPEQPILTLTDAKAKVEMELIISNGRGYLTVEEREKEKADIGTIMIDALYSPVVNVNFEVENVRVGQMTDYERLILKIETDGTITGQEVMAEASSILADHFNFLVKELGGQVNIPAPVEKIEKEAAQLNSDFKESVKETVASEAVTEIKKKRGRPKKIA